MNSEEEIARVSGHQTTRKYYAHSLPGRPQEEWQLLEDHLKKVAQMARGFSGNLLIKT